MRPPGALDVTSRDIETMLAVAAGHHTVRSIGRALGVASPSTAHNRLLDARGAGLVDWTPGLDATIHTPYRLVAMAEGGVRVARARPGPSTSVQRQPDPPRRLPKGWRP